jgi:SAM-dependent methyltransferase
MYIALLILIFLILITFFYSIFRAISWFPMWSKDTKNVLDLAEVKSGQKIYDLGCGDGKLLFAAARLGAKAEGLEISVLPYLLAKIRQLFSKDKVTIKFRDFWLVNLSDADVVFFFLIPRIYPQLTKKLKKELKPGTKVVAYAWPIKEWQPIKVSKRDEGPAIYLYQI